MPEPIHSTLLGVDLTPRVYASTAVVASPTAATETIIASTQVTADVSYVSGVLLLAYAAFTVGTNGVSANLQVRQTSVSGTIKAATGLVTQVATELKELVVVGFDAAPAAGQIYKATLVVTSASAGSTVSNVALVAVAI